MGLNSEEDVPLTSQVWGWRIIPSCLLLPRSGCSSMQPQLLTGVQPAWPQGVLCSDGLFRASRIKEDLKFYLG
eukprot:792346-Pelagomonas_calceolata.AAC.1